MPTVERGFREADFWSMEIAGDLDEVDVWLVHLPEELASVCRQRLDVAALAFGVDGVERERTLARTREPREDDESISRKLE